jgi:L-aspartate oxidase
MAQRFDFLVIGSGIAGLSFALKAAEHGQVILLSKAELNETNTRYAQGGIASVMYKPDSFEKHIKDTIVAGSGYCNEDVVRAVVSEAPDRINELIDLGVGFDLKEDGKYDLAKEGGHSEHRVLHNKDKTGEEIQYVLERKVRANKNITVREKCFAIDLLTQHHQGEIVKRHIGGIECYGAYIFDMESKKVETILSKITVVATGGIGNLYQTTTNPEIATGDGIAMVYRAKGIIENMEFIQFHPTSLYNPDVRPSFLITEALRGYGALLRNSSGEKFMNRYDPRGSLAPRDIVARAIDNELKVRGEDFVYLDGTHLEAKKLLYSFPNITNKCLTLGIDISKDMIPVVPAAHYLCGGVKVFENGESTINRLYAIGEVGSTGLHGANRLASNSLLEAVVYAHRASSDSSARLKDLTFQDNIPDWDFKGAMHPEEMVLVTQNYKELQMIMSNYVGIVRSDLRLERALKRLQLIYIETEELYKKSLISRQIIELRNLINVGYLVIKMASNRKDSLGLHYSIDHPSNGRAEF